MGSRRIWFYPSGIAGDIHSGVFIPPPDLSFEWWQQTNEPLRTKKPIPTGMLSGFTGDLHTGAFVPPDTSLEWHPLTNEPLRVKIDAVRGAGFTGDIDSGAVPLPPDTSFEWWQQTNEPPKGKKPLPVGLYSGFTGDLHTGAFVPPDESFEWWSNTNVPFFIKKDVVRGSTFEGNLDLGAAVVLRFSKRKMRVIQVGVPLD